MKYKTTQARGLAAALTLFGSFIGGANAALLINWQQDGANVVATASGSIEAPLTYSFNDFSFPQDSYLYSQGAYIGVAGSSAKDVWEGSYTGSFSAAFSMTSIPLDSGVYVGVGIAVNGGIVDSSYIYGSSINSSSTWTSTDLLTLGLSVDDNQTFTYNTASGTDTITFQVTPVPEPSSAILLALGGLGLASRRSRR